ncbi:MAG: sugar kinase [Firmicutes bacterium]|nr:sugar kinase [Bacillota bacterium]
MHRIVTFGEIMIRLQPYDHLRFVQADSLEFTFGGAEANVAVSLADFGMDSVYVTKLPAHEIGQCAVNSLRRYGVDVSKIVRGGDRVGIYFNEKGASQRGGMCIYDRAHSAIAEAEPSDFDWDKIFEGADWFHFTGITPALSPSAAKICEEACIAAKARGIKISFDPNYRARLWTLEEAKKTISKLSRYVDLCITNPEQAADIYGIGLPASEMKDGKLSREGCVSAAKQLAEAFGFEKVAFTLRESYSASINGWSGMIYDAKTRESAFSKEYKLYIVDRVGGGDSFAAGLIYSLLKGSDLQTSVDIAAAASALKHSIEGDFNMVSIAEAEKLAAGDGSGRIQR